MSKTAKILVSVIGLGAILVPAALLMFFAPKTNQTAAPAAGNRSIDTSVIDQIVNKSPVPATSTPIPVVYSTPSPTVFPSASPSSLIVPEGSPSAQ